jgi:hypothetical protein
MRYLKLYEEFKFEQEVIEPEVQTELSDKTTDDILNDDFFKEEEKEETETDEVFQDKRGVYHIKNWNVY